MARYSKAEVADAREYLLKVLDKGDTVYCVLRHVSASGMQRAIDLYVLKDNAPRYLSGMAAIVLGWPLHKRGGIKVGGCGMDMGFHTTYELSACLFPDYVRDDGNKDGGYALSHSWL